MQIGRFLMQHVKKWEYSVEQTARSYPPFFKNKNIFSSIILIGLLLLLASSSLAQRKMEKLGRGVVATRTSSGIFISWRLLGTEPSDLGFNIYRSANGSAPIKLNSTVLTQGTNWTDATANVTQTNSYFIKAISNGIEQTASAAFSLAANTPVQPFFKVPIINTPGYGVRYVWVGDLDSDGEYDFVFDKHPFDDSKVILLEAYKRDGTFLWQMDCGPNSVNKYNISPGSSTLDIGHGDNFTVYDITGDGKAEVIVRTANGVKFSNGATVVDSNDANQFISVLDGMTGVEISRTPYNNPYLSRGAMNGHLGIAYLDGVHPSIVWEAKNRNADESFNEMTTAWDWNGSTLVPRWRFLTGNQNCPAGHQIKIADVDGDGKDEVVPMGFVIDDDGTLLHSLGNHDIYHGDRFYVGDLDPDHPGLEMYGIQQGYSTTGIMWYYCDAKTGQIFLTQKDPANHDMGRGMTGDFNPNYAGYEFYTFVDALYNVSGARTSTAMPSSYPNLRFWWDGDLGSENLDNSKFTKWNYANNREDRLYTAKNILSVGPNVPSFYGDILGDWREEVIYETSDHNSLTIFTTPYPTDVRIYTLPHNPKYRADMTVRGYSQSHMTDFYLGYGMKQPPVPPIQIANKYWKGTTLVWDNNSANWTTGSADAAFANSDTVMFDIRGNNADTIQLNGDLSPGRMWAMNPKGKDYVIASSGKLTGPMDLIKVLDGNITLSGNHDYTGLTRISEGALYINGSLQSKVLVQPKGSLGGSGSLHGGITLEQGLNIDGAGLKPGNGSTANLLGTLKITGNVVAPGKNNFTFDIIPNSTKVNDSIVVNGDLSFNGTNNLIINFENNTPVPGVYTLMQCTGTLTAAQENFVVRGFMGVPKQLIIETNQIKLRILSQRAPRSVVWKGTVDNVWDFEKTNFMLAGDQSQFVSYDTVRYDESATQKSIQLTETAITSGITFDATSDYTISGPGAISGSGDLIKLNTNKVSLLSPNNTYTGKTIVNGGTLTVSTINLAGEASSLGSANVDPANIVINDASLIINDWCTTDRGVTITGNTTINVPSSNSYAIFIGEITGSGMLIKEGAGAIYLGRQNSFTGQAIIRNGAINLRNNAGNERGLGASGVVTIENGTLFMEDVRNYSQARWNIIVPADKNATLVTDGRGTLLGSLTGSGALNIAIPYVRTDFKGNWSAFTGKINLSGSDFRIGNNFGYANAAINMVSGTAYTISGSGSSVSIGELSSAVGTTISGTSWIVGAKNTDATFAGVIVSNSITKVGSGTWTLTGANTYTGTTIVNAGKLTANNTKGSATGKGAVTVNNASTLSGAGRITGTVTINNGTLAPGNNGIGKMIIKNNVTLTSASTLEVEINLVTNDLLDSLSTLKINGTLKLIRTDGSNFVLGNSYKLFNAITCKGSFAAIDPASPGVGMAWDTTALRSTGIIKVKGTQSISFTLPNNKKASDPSFNLQATGGASGNSVTFSIVSGDAVTLLGSTVTIVKPGSVNIIASQAGNNNYYAAADVIQTLTIGHPPVASFTATPTSGYAPLLVSFDASASADVDNDSLTYVWDFGDGESTSGKVVSHTYLGPGSYSAVLLLEDSRGDVSSDTAVISTASGLKAQYRARVNEINPIDNHIKPHFQIVNTTDKPVPYSELTLRYWFTSEGNANEIFWCDYAALGTNYVKGSITPMATPFASADHYLEVHFTSPGSLAPGSNSGEIQTRFNKEDWSNFIEFDDYSYDPTKTQYEDWSKVTLYRNGKLFWGVEPVSTDSAGEFISSDEISFSAVVSPNPTRGDITLIISSSQVDNFQVKVLDMLGRTAGEARVNAASGENVSVTIPMSSDHKEGTYILKVMNSKNKVIIKKVILIR